MNKNIYILIIILLLGSNGYFINKGIRKEKELESMSERYNSYNATLNNLDNLLMSRYTLEDKRINQNTSIINIFGDTLKLKKIIKNKPKIIFKYYSQSCNACRKEELQLLLKYEEKIGSENIIILTDFKNFRENRSLISGSKSNIQIYSVTNKELGLPKDFHYSFVFITDSTFRINLPYTPIYLFKENIEEYHKYIYEKYYK